MYSANTIFFTAAALPFILRISGRLTLFAVVPLPVASILIQMFGTRIHKRFERIQAMFSDISAKAQENFSGARLIRAFAQEDAEIASFETANQEYIGRSLHLVRLMAMLWPTLEFVLGISLVITLWVGGHQVLTHRITVGQFTEFMVYMVNLTFPMIALGYVVNLFQRGTASIVRIDELLKAQPTITDAEAVLAAQTATTLQGDIRFPKPDLRLPRSTHHSPQHQSAYPCRHLARDRRPHRLRQIHPRQPHSPPLRRSRKLRLSRQLSPPHVHPRYPARKHRRSPSGNLPVLRHHRSQRVLWRPRRHPAAD